MNQNNVKDLAAPRIEVKVPKSFLEVLISEQGEGFHLKLQKAALHHAVTNGCKNIVPSDAKIQKMINNFLAANFSNEVIEYKELGRGRVPALTLTKKARTFLESKVKLEYETNLNAAVNQRCGEVLEEMQKQLDDYLARIQKRYERKMNKHEATIRSFEDQMAAWLDDRLGEGTIKFIEEEIDRRVTEKLKARDAVKKAVKGDTE